MYGSGRRADTALSHIHRKSAEPYANRVRLGDDYYQYASPSTGYNRTSKDIVLLRTSWALVKLGDASRVPHCGSQQDGMFCIRLLSPRRWLSKPDTARSLHTVLALHRHFHDLRSIRTRYSAEVFPWPVSCIVGNTGPLHRSEIDITFREPLWIRREQQTGTGASLRAFDISALSVDREI